MTGSQTPIQSRCAARWPLRDQEHHPAWRDGFGAVSNEESHLQDQSPR